MKNTFLVIIITLLGSCSNRDFTYNYSYSDQEFIKVLSDLFIAEQVIRNHGSAQDSLRNSLRTQIFSIHEIKDSSKFIKEFDVLMKDIKKYKNLSELVVKRLDSLESDIKKK